jgi:hypothetical protein
MSIQPGGTEAGARVVGGVYEARQEGVGQVEQRARRPRQCLGARDLGGEERPRCRLRDRGAECVSECGLKWMSGGAVRHCTRALPSGPVPLSF